jgi:hypothetical protein
MFIVSHILIPQVAKPKMEVTLLPKRWITVKFHIVQKVQKKKELPFTLHANIVKAIK